MGSIQMPGLEVNMAILLGVIVIALIWLLWNFHRDKDNTIDIADLICHDGKINERKVARFGAWLVSTWGFVYLIMDGKFSEWYFAGYMAAWTGNALIDKYIDNKTNNAHTDSTAAKSTP